MIQHVKMADGGPAFADWFAQRVHKRLKTCFRKDYEKQLALFQAEEERRWRNSLLQTVKRTVENVFDAMGTAWFIVLHMAFLTLFYITIQRNCALQGIPLYKRPMCEERDLIFLQRFFPDTMHTTINNFFCFVYGFVVNISLEFIHIFTSVMTIGLLEANFSICSLLIFNKTYA